MTCFNDHEILYPSLEIVETKSSSHAKALTLKVHPPVIGAIPLNRKLLETSLHHTEWSMTETKDVMDNFLGKIVTKKVLLLKSSTHQNGVVTSSPSRNGSLSSWRVPPSGFGEDSCVCLGSLSKLNIPKRPLDNGPFRTREYLDWWPAHPETMLRQNTHIVLRGSKENDTPSATKGDQL
ncbi:hypothetical protein CQW23_01118 [Capsicum baccatum]|uniref:Uncharacterized protein n=1 Tax=Capsicum baccatum TaxID=33114 RepID=A0A2G2XMN8_CAPBA|nr:hypothetical protein CQW23_01118 [Capsicum baccatum]